MLLYLKLISVISSILLLLSNTVLVSDASEKTGFLKAYNPEGKKDPQSYVQRYNTEPKYKSWFDKNWGSKYKSIYEAVGLPEPTKSQMNKITCGLGTVSKNGICVPDENYKNQLKKQQNQKPKCSSGNVDKNGACVTIHPTDNIDECSSSFIQFQCSQSYLKGRAVPDVENFSLCVTNSGLNCDNYGSPYSPKIKSSPETCAFYKEQLLMVKVEKKSLTSKEMASMSHKYESLMKKESDLIRKMNDASCPKS